MTSKVDQFIEREKQWQAEFRELRRILLDCGLTEELKWGVPCYTHLNRNVVLIHGFKKYCALLFHKGALLPDKENLLFQQTKNVQAARQMRFTAVDEVSKLKGSIRNYVLEAIQLEESGAKVEFKKTQEFEMPSAFKTLLDKDAALKEAFDSLTPGRKRGYLLHFSQAKQLKTVNARIEKNIPKILAGKGLMD